jgi:hypothetical protein
MMRGSKWLLTTLGVCLIGLGAPSAAGAEATIAKKQCKKGKASKKKCKSRDWVPSSGNYGLQALDGRLIGGLMRYERLGLYPDPRPYLGAPDLYLRCSDNRGNYFPAMEIEVGAATRLTKKSRQFDFSGPPAGDPRIVTGTVRITGHWVAPDRIFGTLEVTNVSYDDRRVISDPEEAAYPYYYAYSCLDESVKYTAYR